MEDSDEFLDHEYEKLNDAILESIVASKDVRDILARFKEQNQMNEKAVLNLFLSLDELYQMISEKYSNASNYKLEPKQSSSEKIRKKENKPPLVEGSVIDGKALTLNEILFEKYFQGTFDETDWMKKVRVRF